MNLRYGSGKKLEGEGSKIMLIEGSFLPIILIVLIREIQKQEKN